MNTTQRQVITQDDAHELLSAAVTLADAICTRAPRDFMEAALRDVWQAACKATGIKDPEELPAELFRWGPTLDYETRDRLAARWGLPKEPT